MTTFTTEDRLAADKEPSYKDILVGDFNLRFTKQDNNTWICLMPTWLLDEFEKEVKK